MNFRKPSRVNFTRSLDRSCLVAGVLLLVGVTIAGGVRTTWAAPTPTPVPAATPTPTATPTATPSETTEVRNYDGTQQANYIKTANDAFLEARSAKSVAFTEANNAFLQAGGASGNGLTSKEAIQARRDMIQKASQANDDYLTFVATQEKTYRDELGKTPLIKADVDGVASNFVEHAKTPEVTKMRETERSLLKTADSMMEFLDKKYGFWKLSSNKPVFKKASDANAYSVLAKKYNTDVQTVQGLSAEINAPTPTPGISPVPNVSPSPAGAVQPPAAVSPAVASPAPTTKTKP